MPSTRTRRPAVPLAVPLALASLALLTAGCRSSLTPEPDTAEASTSAVHTAPGGAAPTAAAHPKLGTDPGRAGAGTPLTPREGNELAAFAQGCFWGSEDTYRQVPGVVATTVGYSGGHTEHPTYDSVCAHGTGHAETVLVEFDPKKVSYDKLLEVFFATHDPTTKDRQGPDIGDQYRSAVFTFGPAQEASARAAAARAGAELGLPVTTEIRPIGKFWIAEDYHQQYDEKAGHRSCPLPSRFKGGT
jgi:peptide-methionine (S)-S-oxide reductase